MKEVRAHLIILIISFLFSNINGQQYKLNKLINCFSCEKLRVDKNMCVYTGLSKNQDSIYNGIFLKKTDDTTSRLIVRDAGDDFLEWINDENIAFYEKDNDTLWLVNMDIKTMTKNKTVINNKILNSCEKICYDDSTFIFVAKKNKKIKTFKYSINFNPICINHLNDIDIRKIVYNKEKDIIAYSILDKNNNDSINIFFFTTGNTIKLDDKIGKLWDVVEDVFCFSKDDMLSFYYLAEDTGYATIKKYDFQNKIISKIYKLPRGVKCTDIRTYENKIYLTLYEDEPGVLESLTFGSIKITNSLDLDISIGIAPQGIYELSPQ
jgi:hypothetical protein